MSQRASEQARQQQLLKEGRLMLLMEDPDAFRAEFRRWEKCAAEWLDEFVPGYSGEFIALDAEDIDTYLDTECLHLAKPVVRRRIAWLSKIGAHSRPSPEVPSGDRIVIGHGHSPVWKDLREFLKDRLGLKYEEFSRESSAGVTTQERLHEMLDSASFAFLVMTAEDEHADSTLHARENVIHEVGLFQGRLGFRKAIVLLEAGCKEFSNIVGLGQIRFPKGDISARFEEIRKVLEREKIIHG